MPFIVPLTIVGSRRFEIVRVLAETGIVRNQADEPVLGQLAGIEPRGNAVDADQLGLSRAGWSGAGTASRRRVCASCFGISRNAGTRSPGLRRVGDLLLHIAVRLRSFQELHVQRNPLLGSRQRPHHPLHVLQDVLAAQAPIQGRLDGLHFAVRIAERRAAGCGPGNSAAPPAPVPPPLGGGTAKPQILQQEQSAPGGRQDVDVAIPVDVDALRVQIQAATSAGRDHDGVATSSSPSSNPYQKTTSGSYSPGSLPSWPRKRLPATRSSRPSPSISASRGE